MPTFERKTRLDLSSGRFFALESGNEEGPVVLCLHGFPDHPQSFGRLLERLGAAGYRVLAPYMRGYFPSTLKGPYSVEQLGADVIAMSEEMSPDVPVAVVGHDWGAVATYQAIAARPDRFFAAAAMAVPHPTVFLRGLRRNPSQLARSWYMMFFQLPVLPERALAAGNFALVEALWRRWSPGCAPDPESMRRLKETLAASMPAPIEYYRALTRPLSDAFSRLSSGAATSKFLEVPTLYLHGERDACIAPSATRGQEALFRGPHSAQLIAGAGHFFHVERADVAADQIVPWLERYRVS